MEMLEFTFIKYIVIDLFNLEIFLNEKKYIKAFNYKLIFLNCFYIY
jgi:hypothetical protein